MDDIRRVPIGTLVDWVACDEVDSLVLEFRGSDSGDKVWVIAGIGPKVGAFAEEIDHGNAPDGHIKFKSVRLRPENN
jgi:hypothetical protein